MPVKILLIKLSALGDVIQTLPTLEAIRAVYPAAEISWLVEEDAAPVLACHPALDNLLISRRKTWLAAWRRPGERHIAWQQFRHLMQTLRRQPYDLVIDLQGLAKAPSGLSSPAVPARSALTGPGNTVIWPSPNVCRPMIPTNMPFGAI